MKKTELRFALVDLRWDYIGDEFVEALSAKNAVAVDDTGMLRGGAWETSAGESLRKVVEELYAFRGRTFRTKHSLILVQRDRILRIRFWSFDEISDHLVLEPGDVVILYHGS
jgi:hypothetical protein